MKGRIVAALVDRGAGTPRWLAHHLGLSGPAVVRACRAMVEAGTLIRCDDFTDGERVKEQTLLTVTDPTSLGREVLR